MAAGDLDPAVARVVGHWRWAGEEGRGGADPYIRVRDAAQKDAYGRAAAEVERQAPGGPEALLKLAVSLRERALSGDVPGDVQLPAWRADRPAPKLDEARVRREQQIGFTLAWTACAAQLNEAAGGEI